MIKQLIFSLLFLAALMGCKETEIATAPQEVVEVAQKQSVVATTIPALEAILKELLKSTAIMVTNPMDSTTTLDQFESYFADKEALLDSLALSVDMVADIRSIIPEDMLYIKLRERNIKIIHTKCASPESSVMGAIGNIKDADGHINPYIWLAPTNMIRMAEIMSHDLGALYPNTQKSITENLQTLKSELLALKLRYDMLFLELDRFDAAVMDQSFPYFLKDIDLYIVQTYPPEIDWDSTVTIDFTTALTQKQFATIVHRWEPFGNPKDLADSAGVTFTILTLGLPKGAHFDNGIIAFAQGNLEALYQALKRSSLNKSIATDTTLPAKY